MSNPQAGTKGLSENMEAAKSNFLLKGFFKKKKKAEAKKQAAIKKQADLKKKNELSGKTPLEKNAADKKKNYEIIKPEINTKDSLQ